MPRFLNGSSDLNLSHCTCIVNMSPIELLVSSHRAMSWFLPLLPVFLTEASEAEAVEKQFQSLCSRSPLGLNHLFPHFLVSSLMPSREF